MKIFLMLAMAGLVACSSKPVNPNDAKVTVSRDPADDDCRLIGDVKGTTQGVKADLEKAIEDMKRDAALKGGNYVRMENTSAFGTAVQGTAYDCP